MRYQDVISFTRFVFLSFFLFMNKHSLPPTTCEVDKSLYDFDMWFSLQINKLGVEGLNKFWMGVERIEVALGEKQIESQNKTTGLWR